LEPGGMHVVVSRPDVTNPADVIEEIITNTVWGLSSVNVDYAVDSTFAVRRTKYLTNLAKNREYYGSRQ
jgi:hypothetical protein